MSICVAMVNAHKVEQGLRVCPRLMVVLTQTLFGQLHFSYWITGESIFQWPEDVSSVNGCFNANSVWAVAFFLLDHKGKYFCILSSRIIRVSNFIGPRKCPRLLVALTQTVCLGCLFYPIGS